MKCCRILLPLLVIACCAADPATAPATMPANPRPVVEKGVHDVISTLLDPNLTRDAKRQRVTELTEHALDLETLSRLSLGQVWRDLPQDKRNDFVREFGNHVLSICRNGTDQYRGTHEVVVVGDKPEARGDWTVQTSVIGHRDDGTPHQVATVDFRLRPIGGRWKVIDVTIEGVSLAATFRAQFGAVMANGGFDRLMQILRDKNTANAQVLNPRKDAR